MAMAVEVVRRRVCDVCGESEGVQRVRISLLFDGTKTKTVDLCPEHMRPMIEAMDAKDSGGLRKKRTVTPRKEVAARKRTARKRA